MQVARKGMDETKRKLQKIGQSIGSNNRKHSSLIFPKHHENHVLRDLNQTLNHKTPELKRTRIDAISPSKTSASPWIQPISSYLRP